MNLSRFAHPVGVCEASGCNKIVRNLDGWEVHGRLLSLLLDLLVVALVCCLFFHLFIVVVVVSS